MNLTLEREMDDRLLEGVKRARKDIERAGMPTFMRYEQEQQVRAFDRILQKIIKAM